MVVYLNMNLPLRKIIITMFKKQLNVRHDWLFSRSDHMIIKTAEMAKWQKTM